MTFILSVSTYVQLDGQQDIIYDDMIYVPYIKSVVFAHRSLSTSLPIIDLNSGYEGALRLEFDDIEGGFKNYTYSIVHCDKDWYPSGLDEIEYMEGFNGEEVDAFEFSSNPYSEYTHYVLDLPNFDLKWTISGNYLLTITDDDYGVPVLTRRFMVAENEMIIGYELLRPRNVQKMNTHHELNISINFEGFNITRPRDELYISVVQNGNWNSALSNLQGNFVVGDDLKFNQYDQITFPALKEFRSFDIRTLDYTTEFVNAIERNDYETNVLLDLNKKRYDRNFLYEEDANGFFVLDNLDVRNGVVSSEYCNVIFNLESHKQFDQELYIVGAFSDWQAKEEYRLEYDSSRELYLGDALFKQGYYDYMFALRENDGFLNIEDIEGSYYETENDYLIIVYYRPLGAEFDRIVGVTNFSSSPTN
jgi:hypothetical protein